MTEILDNAAGLITQVVRSRQYESGRHMRPLGLFLLSGPDSARAIHIARVVAQSVFGDSEAVIRFEMSDYKEKYLICKLVGSPPAIVGYGPPGLLIEPVRLSPQQVILLEMIEEAHTDAQNMLLAIAKQSFLVDNLSRQVNFRGVVILMTTEGGVPPQSVILPDLFDLLDCVIDCGCSPRT